MYRSVRLEGTGPSGRIDWSLKVKVASLLEHPGSHNMLVYIVTDLYFPGNRMNHIFTGGEFRSKGKLYVLLVVTLK